MKPEEIKAAIKEAMQEKMTEFYIERERHYKDHEFVTGVRQGIGTARKAGIWTAVATVVASIVGATIYAIFGWK